MAGKTYIVEEGPNPSTDYFVLPALLDSTDQIIKCRWSELPAKKDLLNSTIIFVRYVPSSWRRLITAVFKSVSLTNTLTPSSLNPIAPKLIYFMDDDLLDTSVSRGQTWRYRYKLAHLGAWQKNWLLKMNTEYWVSTPWLQEKYKHLNPTLVLPKPLSLSRTLQNSLSRSNQPCKVFYHGSASHADEIRWLHPIMQTVLKENEQIVFEIIGDAATNRLYRNLPRVNVVYPMKWPSYQAFIATPGRDIGLAPMLANEFNLSRSYTKLFDITRAGAAGIYAAHGPWKKILTNEVNGILIPGVQTAWIEAILQLSTDENQRKKIIAQAKITISAQETSHTMQNQSSEA